MRIMDKQLLNFEIDHLETLGRKDGVLFVQKSYHRNRDLLFALLDSLDRSVVLISKGRALSKLESINHPNLRSVIRISENEPNGLLNWSDDLNLFQYVAPSLERALELSIDLSQRGDIVLFSPYGDKHEVVEWAMMNKENFKNIAIEF